MKLLKKNQGTNPIVPTTIRIDSKLPSAAKGLPTAQQGQSILSWIRPDSYRELSSSGLLIIFCLCITSFAFSQSGTKYEQYFNTSITEQQRKQFKDAIYSYSQKIKKDSENPTLYVNRGITYANLGLHVDAITDYNKAIKLKSNLAEAYYFRGISRARFAFSKGACEDLLKASNLGFKIAGDLYNQKCGRYKSELGKPK